MKARDYYRKYHDGLTDSGFAPAALHAVVSEMIEEMKETANTRHIYSGQALHSLIRETNDKWNAMVSIFEKKDGYTPVKRDGFYIAIRMTNPQLKLPENIREIA